MPHAVGTPDIGNLRAIPERPQTQSTIGTGGLETVVAAGESLSAETSETAQTAHTQIVEQQRRDAAEQAARAEREAKRWLLPVSNYRITAGFGSGGSMWASTHTGLDFAAPTGTEVRAISSGEVIFAGWEGPYGNKIAIRHWDGTVSWYAHLSRFVVRSGTVTAGQIIGRVGSTGNSTGPHLHLEIHPGGGGAVNPRTWLKEHGVTP